MVFNAPGLLGTAVGFAFFQTMGCNTSKGTTVVDPSEKPKERPKTATSTEETSPEETNEAAEKEEVEEVESVN